MFLLLILAFAGVSLLFLIVGGVLTLIYAGQTRHRSGPEVGAEIMSDSFDPENGGQLNYKRSFFVGKAFSVERYAAIDFAEVKQELAAGNCLGMIPALMAISGFMGVFFSIGVVALLVIPNIWISGGVMLAVLWLLLRMVFDFIRA